MDNDDGSNGGDMMPSAAAPTATEISAALETSIGSNSKQQDQDQVVALFPYTAQNDDELSFLQGDVIRVVDREDAAWWKGQIKGQVYRPSFQSFLHI